MKWLKWALGVLLLPAALSSSITLWRMLKVATELDQVWVPFGAGFMAFLLLFLWVPKPMWIYVVGHELTHALWVILFGGKVRRLKATARGGHVVVTKSNVLISLAPYFFPLYSSALILVYGLVRMWRNGPLLGALFHVGLGFTVAFHLLMNWEVLKVRQPDWMEHGMFFSGVVVWLGNGLVFGFAVSCLHGEEGIERFGATLFQDTAWLLRNVWQIARGIGGES